MIFNFNKKTINVGVAEFEPYYTMLYISISYSFQETTVIRFVDDT